MKKLSSLDDEDLRALEVQVTRALNSLPSSRRRADVIDTADRLAEEYNFRLGDFLLEVGAEVERREYPRPKTQTSKSKAEGFRAYRDGDTLQGFFTEMYNSGCPFEGAAAEFLTKAGGVHHKTYDQLSEKQQSLFRHARAFYRNWLREQGA